MATALLPLTHPRPTRRARAWSVVLAGLIVGGLALCLYPALKLRWASRRVAQFCREAPAPGARIDVAALVSRGRALQLRVDSIRRFQGWPARVLAWEGWIFARYFCAVDYEGGRVTRRHQFFLD